MTELAPSPTPRKLDLDPTRLEWARLLEEALTMPGAIGRTYNRFYEYSFMNQMLLYMQGVTEPVNTYNRWKDMGRQVKKGSKAKAILRPILVKERQDDGSEKQRLKGFKMLNCLFTVSDTEGEPLPEVQMPTWDRRRALGALAIGQVRYDLLDGNTQGYSVGRMFAINPVAAYPLKTMFHEIGHIKLGHTTPERLTEYQTHRGIYEFQAESCAYLLCNELEVTEHMDMAESRAYIQTWLCGQVPEDTAIRAVFQATDAILKAGRSKSAPELEVASE